MENRIKKLEINPLNVRYYTSDYILGWRTGVSAQYNADSKIIHGEWIGIEYDGYADGAPVYDVYECSICGNEIRTENPPQYCCDCGARNEVRYEYSE